jgi:hypothetical protein
LFILSPGGAPGLFFAWDHALTLSVLSRTFSRTISTKALGGAMSYRSVFRGGLFAGRHAVVIGGGSGDSRKVLAFRLSICREAEIRPLRATSFGVARMLRLS